MRKSNWIIVGILVLASIIFLIMWYVLGFNFVDDPFDLVLTICWWVLIIAICIIIAVVENRRKRTIRTMFVAPGLIFNTELGVVNLKDGENYAQTIRKMLSNLDYNFEKKDVRNDTKVRFKYIVHTDKFSNNGNTWEGDVVQVSNPKTSNKFTNESELNSLLSTEA